MNNEQSTIYPTLKGPNEIKKISSGDPSPNRNQISISANSSLPLFPNHQRNLFANLPLLSNTSLIPYI